MIVKIGAKVFVMNAFLSLHQGCTSDRAISEPNSYLEIEELRLFADILTDGLNQAGYKYAIIDANNEALKALCDTDNFFVKGIGKIFATKRIESNDVEKVNSKYEPEISAIIENAREKFNAEMKYKPH